MCQVDSGSNCFSSLQVMDLSDQWKVRKRGKDVSRPSGHLLPLLLRILHVLLWDVSGAHGPEVLPLHGNDPLRPFHIHVRPRLCSQHTQFGLLYQYSGKLSFKEAF